MATTRKSFILYTDTLSILDLLTDEQAGQLFKLIRAYQMGDTEQCNYLTQCKYLQLAFESFKIQFERDEDKYLHRANINRANGCTGGRPRKFSAKNETLDNEDVNKVEKPKKPNGFFGFSEKPKKPYNDNDNDSDNDNTPPIVVVLSGDDDGDGSAGELSSDKPKGEPQPAPPQTAKPAPPPLPIGQPPQLPPFTATLDEEIAQLQTPTQWSSRAMDTHGLDHAAFARALKAFALHCETTGKRHSSLRDARMHFSLWLARVDKTQFTNPQQNPQSNATANPHISNPAAARRQRDNDFIAYANARLNSRGPGMP